jgi:hypothetical protein
MLCPGFFTVKRQAFLVRLDESERNLAAGKTHNESPRRKQRGIFTGAMFLSPQAAGNLP